MYFHEDHLNRYLLFHSLHQAEMVEIQECMMVLMRL